MLLLSMVATLMISNMKISNESGFSVVEGLAVLGVVAILGLAGWYVWHSKHNIAEHSRNSTTQTGNTVHQSPPVQLPAGWVWYEGDGFKFGYPMQYKQFAAGNTTYATSGTQALFTSGVPDTVLFPGLSPSGVFVLTKLQTADTPLVSRKYGPTVKLVNGKWIVTQDNPGDPTPYKTGSAYTEVTVDKVHESAIYVFKSGDEGVVVYTLAFVAKSHLYTLQFPEFDMGVYGSVYRPNDQKPYDQLATQLAQHVIVE